jgi:hypothetical protein
MKHEISVWGACVLALVMVTFLVGAAFVILAYAEPLPFRTDQYVPPVVQRPLPTSEINIPPQLPVVKIDKAPCQKD